MTNPCNGYYGKCLDVKITSVCNGNCRFCIEAGGYRPPAVPVTRLIEATNALQDYQKVLVLGGEPFMYPYLTEYLEGIKDKQEIYLTTNGTLFNTLPLEQIAPHLTAVNISIHHYSQAENASVVGAVADFNEVYKAIQVFKSNGVKIRINTNLIKDVLNDKMEILMMCSMAKNLGADEIRFAELQHCPDLYVEAGSVFGDLLDTDTLDDPFTFGCEQLAFTDGNFKVWVRLTCGLVNPLRTAPLCPVRKGSMTKVLYPDGTVSDGWRPGNAAETYAKAKRKSVWYDCHMGCH